MMRLLGVIILVLASKSSLAGEERYHYCIAWFNKDFSYGVKKRVYTDIIQSDLKLSIIKDSFTWHIETKYSDYLSEPKMNGFAECYTFNTRILEKAKRDLEYIIKEKDPQYYILEENSELITNEKFEISSDI